MPVERTLSIIKPDAIKKNAIGQILGHFDGAGADRASAAEENNVFHLSGKHVTQVQIHNRRIEQQTVEQVEDAADSREKFSGILNAGLTFEDRFNQISDDSSQPE